MHAQGSRVHHVHWHRLVDNRVVSLSNLPFFLERWLLAENILLAKLDLDVSPVGLFIKVVVTTLVTLRIFLAKHISAKVEMNSNLKFIMINQIKRYCISIKIEIQIKTN